MNCKNCGKELATKLPLHFSNRQARLKGYCAFTCMAEKLGKNQAFEMLQDAENTASTVKYGKIR